LDTGLNDVADDLDRRSVAEQIVTVLRERILNGTLAPGSPLPEVALASSFGVSRNTVREAIRLLVHEGLARHLMHRGAAVVELTLDDLVDVHRARVAVELAAVPAAASAGEERLGRLAATVGQLAAAAEADDGRAADEADLAFHRAMVGLLGSSRVDAFYAGLQAEMRLGFSTVNRRLPHPDRVAEHRRLVELARASDVTGLHQAVSEHLDETWANLRRMIGERSA
jgi:DNA-binding GntR family transcriptional regulator